MATRRQVDDGGAAARRWADALAAWAIPEQILAAAPASPYGFDVGLFARIADDAIGQETASVRAARDALPPGGSVLDVGCGAGAASVPLAPPAGLLIGLDEGPGMLGAFAERADATGVAHTEIEGRWPDAADGTPAADVVVCHNVVYNVADLVPFVRALADHARRRVVVELTQEHPLAWMNPYWERVHGVTRPAGPTADDAVEVVREAGFDVQVQRWVRPSRVERTEADVVSFIRRRLCVGPDADPEIRAVLHDVPLPRTRTAVTLWWSPTPAERPGNMDAHSG